MLYAEAVALIFAIRAVVLLVAHKLKWYAIFCGAKYLPSIILFYGQIKCFNLRSALKTICSAIAKNRTFITFIPAISNSITNFWWVSCPKTKYKFPEKLFYLSIRYSDFSREIPHNYAFSDIFMQTSIFICMYPFYICPKSGINCCRLLKSGYDFKSCKDGHLEKQEIG